MTPSCGYIFAKHNFLVQTLRGILENLSSLGFGATSDTSASNFPPLLLRRNVPLDILGEGGPNAKHDIYI